MPAIKTLIIAQPGPKDDATTESSVTQRTDGLKLAYQAGHDAHHAGLISLGARTLYDRLVHWSGDKGYCWHGLARIAEDLLRSISQVGRWLHELTSAALIRRVRHRTGTAFTHITAYDMTDPDCASVRDPDCASVRDRSIKAKSESKELEAQAPPTPQGGRRQDVQLDGRIASERIASATHSEDEIPVTPATELLRAAGVQSPAALCELATRPAEEVRAVIDDVEHRSNVRSIPGLLVKVLKDGLWSKGRRKGAAKERTIEDYTGYCPVCFGYPFCKCEEIIALAEAPPTLPASMVPDGYCEVCCIPTDGYCGHDRIWFGGVPPNDAQSSTDGAREDEG